VDVLIIRKRQGTRAAARFTPEDYYGLSRGTITKVTTRLLVYAAAYSIIRYLCSCRLPGRREAFGFAHALFNVSLDIYGI
jgi:hypothetical protein